MQELLRPLSPGDWVLVFVDPVTRTHVEGPARLTKKVPFQRPGDREYWNVKFPCDEGETARFVSALDRIVDLQIWDESRKAYLSSCPDETIVETGEGVDDGD